MSLLLAGSPASEKIHGSRRLSHPRTTWSAPLWSLLVTFLTTLAFAVAGWHPYAEDGGMYLTRVLLRLQPTLFPRCRPFIVEPLRCSLFEPLVAGLVRCHLPLPWATLALDLAALWLTLAAALLLARRITLSEPARLAGVALLATWLTIPVAGTSLLLVDPYLTARSLSTPFALFATAFALDNWRGPRTGRRSLLLCASSLALAFAFHPLMAAYAAALVVLLRAARGPRVLGTLAALAILSCSVAALLQWLAPPASPALRAAELSRYYWFLSQWHWYEWLGILGPALIFAPVAAGRVRGLTRDAITLTRGVLALVAIAVLISLGFAQEHLAAHAVARLQPLRTLASAYALLPLLLGILLAHSCEHTSLRACTRLSRNLFRAIPAIVITGAAILFFAVQRTSFPASPHLEFPGRSSHNPWVEAFLWSRDHTAPTALFALDARYVNRDGEDAQNFRAISRRSSLPDYSKDGGETAIQPSLAELWLPAAQAQKDLSLLSPDARAQRLRPFAPDWMILDSTARTRGPCPYDNGTVKVCPFRP